MTLVREEVPALFEGRAAAWVPLNSAGIVMCECLPGRASPRLGGVPARAAAGFAERGRACYLGGDGRKVRAVHCLRELRPDVARGSSDAAL